MVSCCLYPCLLSFSRLLSQLDETERAFDEFWVRHQTKLEQCLQLRHFEHNYREVSWSPRARAKSPRARPRVSSSDLKSDRGVSAAGEVSVGSGV